jgi:heptosyltransferase-1
MPDAILLIRLSAIGDNVFASSLIPPLRKRYPDARIYWLTQPESAPLFAHNPRLDGVITLPIGRFRELAKRGRYLSLLRALHQFRTHLRSFRFDLAIDLQGLLKSGLAAWACGARRRIALGSREGSALLMHEVVPRRLNDTDINAEYRDLAEHLGLAVEPFAMDLAVSADADARASALVDMHALHRGFIALVPFTTRPQKHWVDAHWSALIARLHVETGRRIVVLGGPGDATACERLLAGVENADALVPLVGDSSVPFEDVSALIRRADLLIGVDTGMTHMAVAHRRPTIAVFGSTLPYLTTRTPAASILYADLDCAPCHRHPTCAGAFTCMRKITPDAVLAQANRLLAPARQSPPRGT